MRQSDLQAARSCHAALKLIVSRHAGESADLRALRRVVDLCRGFSEAIDDGYAREKIGLLAEFSAEMLAHSDHQKWDRAAMRGVDFLKQHIGGLLELLESRLYSLEFMRRPAAARSPALLSR
jgi:hypothetical protein